MKQQNNKTYKNNKVNINKNSNVPKLRKKNKAWAVLTAAALGIVLGVGTFAGLCYGVPEIGNLVVNHNTQTTKPNTELEEYKLKMEKLNNNIVELTAKIENITAEKLTLENQVKTLNSEHATQVAEIQAKLTAKEAALADTQQELENLQNAVDASENEITSLEAQIEALTAEKAELEAQIETLNTEHETQVNELNMQIETLTTAKADLEKQLKKANSDVNYYKSQMEALETKVNNYDSLLKDSQKNYLDSINFSNESCDQVYLHCQNIANSNGFKNSAGDTLADKFANVYNVTSSSNCYYKVIVKTKDIINLASDDYLNVGFNYIYTGTQQLNMPAIVINSGNDCSVIYNQNNSYNCKLYNINDTEINTNEFIFFVRLLNNYTSKLSFCDLNLYKGEDKIVSKIVSIEKMSNNNYINFIGYAGELINA